MSADISKLKEGCLIYFEYNGEQYSCEAMHINHEEKYVCVYVPYMGGQDMIPFEKIILIHEEDAK